MATPQFKNIDAYIKTFPPDVRARLTELRVCIQKAAPDAKEAFSYQMPACTLNGILVYFAAWKNHIGFYAASGALDNSRRKRRPT